MEWDPLFTVLLICEMDPLQCSSNWTHFQPHALRNGTHLISFIIFHRTLLKYFVPLEWDPLIIVLFICEMDTLQCSSNWDPLTASRLTKWDPLNKFLQFSIGRTYKNSSHYNGTYLSPCYSLVKWTHYTAAAVGTQHRALRNGTHLLGFYNFS